MRIRAFCLASILAAASLVALAQEPAEPPQDSVAVPRPKVVLVLSGGGARGSAHIGVIKVLEELHVEPDMIVGTSMGSIIGGLYAAGWPIEEIEAQVSTIDWGTVFIDRIPRKYRSFRRKQDDTYLVPIKMRFKNWKPYIPPSLIGGQSMELLLQRFEIEATGETDFDRFPIPYRAVAADLATGNPFVISKGSLSTAMRASMSVPGIFPPVEMDGKSLCDGGVAANFPVRIAQQLGADVVIGIDISSPLKGKEELTTLLQRIDQTTGLLTAGNVEDDKAAMRPQDILMVPALGDIGFSDFARAGEAIAIGEAAARQVEDRLRPLAVPDAQWAAFQERHKKRTPSDLIVNKVVINNTSYLDDRVVARKLQIPTNAPLNEPAIAQQVLRLNSMDTFGTIHHEMRRDADGQNVLSFDIPKKPYSRNSLQFGFNFETDVSDTTFNLSIAHLYNPINSRGGEWRNVLQIGTDLVAGTSFYQPLDLGLKWYVQPILSAREDNIRLYANGEALAEYSFNINDARLAIGRVFSTWGQLAVGPYTYRLKAERNIGTLVINELAFKDVGLAASFRVDTLDSFTWPTNGLRVDAIVENGFESWGADADGTITRAEVSMAKMIGKNVVFGTVEVANSTQDLVSPTVITLGGFLRLSGLKQDELLGSKGGLARLMYYRELHSFSLGSLSQRLFAGLSLEAGNAYQPDETVDWPSLRTAFSIFVGASTILGPAYVAWGHEEDNADAFYLIIGQRF